MRTFASALKENALSLNNGAVVQLVRIPACHAGGRGFESRPHRKSLREFSKAFLFFLPYNLKKQGAFLILEIIHSKFPFLRRIFLRLRPPESL